MKKCFLPLLGFLFLNFSCNTAGAATPVIVPPPPGNAEISVIQKQQEDYVRQSSQYNFNQQSEEPVLNDNTGNRVPDSHYYAISSFDTMQAANQAAWQVIEACETKRLHGILKNHSEAVKCSNPRIITAFEIANYPYRDIIKKFTEKRLNLARKIDRNKITEAQANAEIALFIKHIEAEENGRSISTRDY